MDVPQREDLSFPRSLPEFQRLFPDDAACAAYLEKARRGDGFVCPHCQTAAEPFRFTSRPGVLRCRKCRRDTGLTAGTVMERSHTSLGVWFWAAYLVASQTPGMSATQFQRQVGLSRYETAFQILHKLRAGMVRPDQDRIGSEACDHVEVDETWVGGRTRGKGRGVHHKLLVASAVEVRQRKPGTKLDKRKGGRYAGRVRLAVVPDRSAESLCGFVEGAVTSGASVITDDWSGYTSLAKRGYKHLAVAERGNSQVAEEYLPIIHLVFANLKTWLSGIHHGPPAPPRSTSSPSASTGDSRPFNAFRSLLGIAGDSPLPFTSSFTRLGPVVGGLVYMLVLVPVSIWRHVKLAGSTGNNEDFFLADYVDWLANRQPVAGCDSLLLQAGETHDSWHSSRRRMSHQHLQAAARRPQPSSPIDDQRALQQALAELGFRRLSVPQSPVQKKTSPSGPRMKRGSDSRERSESLGDSVRFTAQLPGTYAERMRRQRGGCWRFTAGWTGRLAGLSSTRN